MLCFGAKTAASGDFFGLGEACAFTQPVSTRSDHFRPIAHPEETKAKYRCARRQTANGPRHVPRAAKGAVLNADLS